MNRFSPTEAIMVTSDSSFELLDLHFVQEAPYAGCRLCGKVYQSDYDRLSYDLFYNDDPEWEIVYAHATDLRTLWRESHTRRHHTEKEVETLATTGLAFTPAAAHKLAPYGIFPLGNLHGEVISALSEAPRAPEEDSEGD